MKRLLWIVFLGLVLVLSSSTFILAQASKMPKKTPELLSRAKKLYEQNCLPCHGPKGDGKGPAGAALKPPPRDFNIPLSQWTYSKGDLKKTFEVISKGIPNTGMVKWDHLSEEDRWGMVYYVAEFATPQKP